MSDIFEFNIINPVVNTKKPFFNEKKGLFYFHTNKRYKYYVEASAYDKLGNVSYYFLLSNTKFNDNCRTCHFDDYGRIQIYPRGEVLTYIKRECEERGNINVTFIRNEDDYDIWNIY